MDYSVTYGGNAAADAASGAAAAGILGAMIVVWLIIMMFVLAMYIYMAICLMKIAKKTNTPNAWFAWVPILNIILMVQISQKPMWYLVFFFVPFLNFLGIIFGILIWMAISERLGKPSWLGILVIIPIANIILPGYLAFSNSEGQAPVAA